MGGVEGEYEVLEGAEGLVLDVGVEDEEEGVLAGEALFLDLVADAGSDVPDLLFHIGQEVDLANLCSALRDPWTVDHDIDISLDAFGDETEDEHEVAITGQTLGIEVEVFVTHDAAVGIVDDVLTTRLVL